MTIILLRNVVKICGWGAIYRLRCVWLFCEKQWSQQAILGQCDHRSILQFVEVGFDLRAVAMEASLGECGHLLSERCTHEAEMGFPGDHIIHFVNVQFHGIGGGGPVRILMEERLMLWCGRRRQFGLPGAVRLCITAAKGLHGLGAVRVWVDGFIVPTWVWGTPHCMCPDDGHSLAKSMKGNSQSSLWQRHSPI